jgi:hypothetical protein
MTCSPSTRTDHSLEAYHSHGEDFPAFLHARRIHAHVARLAGRPALAADLYRRVALALLTTRPATDPEVEAAAGNADACWRAITDPAPDSRKSPTPLGTPSG